VLALVTAALVTALLATTSVAYSLQNAGFSVTHYAIGFAVGPRASAWDGNILWAVDASDGLYKADAGLLGPGPLTTISATRVNASPVAGYTGIAVGLDGRLYASSTATGDVVELDKTDGHIIRTLSHNGGVDPRAIATDPLSGDVIVAGSGRVWRISLPSIAPAVSIYTTFSGNVGTKAITIGPDGTMFVVNDFGQVWSIESTALAATHTGNASTTPIGSPVADITGVSVVTNGLSTIAQFLMVSTSGGAVYKVSGLASTGTPILVLDGAGAGQQISTGPDHCAYPAMGAEILRVADATGACALALAGLIPPTLSISNVTAQVPHVNDGAQTIRVTLLGAATLPGQDILFTVTGANTMTFHATTDASGTASFSYTSANVGVDTIVATSLVDGFPTTSNAVTIDWQPEIDTLAPTIGFTYTVPSGGTGTTFSCDTTVTSDTQNQVMCGWFTQIPTIQFITTANGSSGLGAATSCGEFTLVSQPGPEGHHQTCTVMNGDGQAQATFTVVINAVFTPPTITANATVNGSPYVAGTLTNGPVTVHFTCSSPIPTALQCPADQTFSATGTFTASGTATDIAGQTSSMTFGPIVIDATPPVVTVDSAPYTFGAWTNADVHLTFHCTDNLAVATCPGPLTVTASTPGVTVTATDTAGNTTTFTTGAINIDRTPPTIVATATTADGHAYVAGTLTNQDVTVHFTCGTDAAPVTFCPPDATFNVSGGAIGSATDAAGNTATATFGPILIDHSPPTITATVTVLGLPYDGSFTRGPVLVHFTCADDNLGVTCPADILLTTDRNAPVTGIATDAAGNTASVTTAPIKIDRTPPVTTATVTGTSAGTPNTYLFTANVALAATDGGSGVAFITYQLDGGPLTVVTSAAASFVVSTEGAHTVTYFATDAAGNAEASHTTSFSIIFRQHTTVAITSAPFLATGTMVSARLLTDAGVPVVGETVTFTACGVTRTGTTDATGTARVDLGLASGTCTLTASFAGSTPYFPSSATAQPITVFAVTNFVVWSPNAVVGATVQFYGGDWSKQVTDKDARKGFSDFKGYAENVYPTYWTARSGDAVKPPKTIPQYIGVILTNSASKTKDVITGDNAGIAIVKVTGDDPDKKKDKAYDGKLGDGGFGTVLAVVRR
jgi:hypothetical protein